MSTIIGPQLASWGHQEVTVLLDHVSVGSWDTVVTLLENAGQYQQIELEVMTLVRTMGDELKRALDQLNMYHALTSLYPAAARTQHRVNMYSLWGSKLMENFGTETCDEIATEFAGLFSARQEHEHAVGAVELDHSRQQVV